jgi:hypothetical protein
MLVEGMHVRAAPIDTAQLAQAWKTLSDKPLPNVKALKLSDQDFNNIIDRRRCPEDQLREIEEWGRVLSTRGTDACVYNGEPADGADYVILVRENPYHTIGEIIVHELSHIARGDL